MGETTRIEWAHHTFNPWRGCQKVSSGCDNCYAEAMTKRFKIGSWGAGAIRGERPPAYWQQPYKWDAKAAKAKVRRRVFCGSMIDVFDNQAPADARPRLWQIIRETPHLIWMLLTKRPENIKEMLPSDWWHPSTYGNVWLGISAEDQERYDHRWPILAGVDAAVRFVSYEPALGPLNIQYQAPAGGHLWPDWVIVGGESGPGARPMQPEWVHRVQGECEVAEIPFYFKQWGTYHNNPIHSFHSKALDPRTNGQGGALLDGQLRREFP